MEFRLLGPLEVHDGDRPVSVGGPRQRALLAILLVHANEVLSADQLVESLWITPPETAGNTLQAHISRLRRTLGSQRIETRKPGYVLHLAEGERDVERFHSLAQRGREALVAGQAERAGDLFREALAVWRGPPLADLDPERFARGAMRRLEEERLAAIEDRIDADLAAGRDTELVPEIEELTHRYELRERLRGQLMLALYRSGRQADALEVYRSTRKKLVDELGIEPGPTLRRLETAILLQDPALELRSTELSESLRYSASRRMNAPPLVGRVLELEQLHHAAEVARTRSNSQLVTLIGSPGVGKSRLTDEFLREARLIAETVVGHCLPYGEGMHLGPMVDVLRQLAGGATFEALARLLAGVPAAARIAGCLAAVANTSSDVDFNDVAWATRRCLETIAARRPLIVVVDDAQWASELLLDLIDYISDWSTSTPILVICLARPEFLARRPTWGGGKTNVTSITLDPLSEDEAEALLDAVPGSLALQVEDRARILEVAEGNPLFLEEMVALAGERVGSPLTVPSTITAILAARLGHLTNRERHVLARAAIVGREPTLEAIATLIDKRIVRDVLPILRGLVRQDFLRLEGSISRSDDAFRFRHSLIREAAYALTPRDERALLHERLGEWVGARADNSGDENQLIVGHHLETAYRLGRYGDDAGARRRRLALRAAAALCCGRDFDVCPGGIRQRVDYLERASALLAAQDAPRAHILVDIGVDLEHLSDWEGARTRYAEARGLALRRGDTRLALYASLLLHLLDGKAGSSFDLTQAMETVKDAFSELRRTGVEDVYTDRARAILASMYLSDGNAQECERLLSPFVANRDERWTRVQFMSLRILMAAWLWGPRTVDYAAARFDEILHRRIPLRVEASVFRYLAVLRAMEGDFEQARAYIDHDTRILNELGLRAAAAGMAVFRGLVELLASEAVSAERDLREALWCLQELGERWYAGGVTAVLAQAVCAQGRFDEAWELVNSSEAVDARDVAVPIWNACTRARILAAKGDMKALALAKRAVDLASGTDHINEQANALFHYGLIAKRFHVEDGVESIDRAATLFARKGNAVMMCQAERARPEVKSPRE